MSVDGIDFWIPQKGQAKKGNPFGSHKYAGKSALRYELGVDIRGGSLVWIQGPYPAGKWPDIKIFNALLANFLEWYEQVEADDGYRGHPNKVKCPVSDIAPAKKLAMQARVRARHETINGRLKIGEFSPKFFGTTFVVTVRSFGRVRCSPSSPSSRVSHSLA